MTEEAKRRLAAILAQDADFGCRCPDCISVIAWAREIASVQFYCHTYSDPEDRADALDLWWSAMTGPNGPKIWPSA